MHILPGRSESGSGGLYRKITINPASIVNKKIPPPIRPPSICQSVLSADLLGVEPVYVHSDMKILCMVAMYVHCVDICLLWWSYSTAAHIYKSRP